MHLGPSTDPGERAVGRAQTRGQRHVGLALPIHPPDAPGLPGASAQNGTKQIY